MEPLTDAEFARTGLHPSLREFAFWDDDGWLNTVHCHKAVLEDLRPKSIFTEPTCTYCGKPVYGPDGTMDDTHMRC